MSGNYNYNPAGTRRRERKRCHNCRKPAYWLAKCSHSGAELAAFCNDCGCNSGITIAEKEEKN